MTQDALRKRYTYLWTGEATAACVFATLLLWSAYQGGVWQQWIARGYSVGVVIFILMQGIVWWRWKLRLLDINQRHMPAQVLHVFARWRRLNWVLIGLAGRLPRDTLHATTVGLARYVAGLAFSRWRGA